MRLRTILLYACLVLVSVWLISSCKSNSRDELPMPRTDTIPIKLPVSTFRIPISYSLSELEQYLNQKIKGRFFETQLSPTKNDKDQVKIEMSKLEPIQISSTKSKLICKVPLHVKATIMNSRLNFITKGIKPVETDLVLELHTPADIDKDWKLVTKFDLVKTRWVKPPIVKIAGIPFNLQQKLDSFLVQNKEKLTGLLDQEINKAVSLEKPVGKIWMDLQKPMIVVKKPPRAYIKFVCHDISGDFELIGNDLVCYTTIKAQVTMVAETKLKAPTMALPRFKPVTQNSSRSDIWVFAFAEFDQLNDEIGAKLTGKEFTGKNFSTRVKEVKTYASVSGLTVLLETKGDIDATMAATVNPRFDSVSQTFIMENFQFKVVSENVLVNMGDALLHDKVRDTVQTYLAIGLDSLIMKVPSLIEGAISKGKTGKAIDLSISEFEILSCAVNMDSKRLHFLVHTQLKSGIELKRINAGKGIKIKPKAKKKAK